MNKAIVIGTYNGRETWSRDCLDSLREYHSGYEHYDVPILTVSIPWELNVIRWVYEHTDIDEFIFLQDTVVVKHLDWIDEVFDHEGSVSLSSVKPFFMYLGKYVRQSIKLVLMDHPEWPEVKNKRQAVDHESEWTNWYDRAARVHGETKYLWPIDDTNVFTGRNGRLNMVIENDHIVKYKGTWSPEMVEDN